MTHYESIDPNKVKEIFARSFAIDKRTGEVKACNRLDCVNCLFYTSDDCMKAKNEWLDQKAFDPEKDIDWSKVPVDTPVLVWNTDTGEKLRRYFCEIKCVGSYIFRTFAIGKTSWSADEDECDRSDWEHCKLYRPEDVEKYRKKETGNE